MKRLEVREKASRTLSGKQKSEEHKLKTSEALKRFWEQKRAGLV